MRDHTPSAPRPGDDAARTIVTLSGRVQGVGFRYTVLAIARRHAVVGTVRNLRDGERLEIDVEGELEAVAAFVRDVLDNPPHGGHVVQVERRDAPLRRPSGFTAEPTA